MKKSLLILAILLLTSTTICANAQPKFYEAIKNCEQYSKQGSASHNGEVYNILITLNKAKGNKCIYKEKIYQDKNYQMLTCEFKQHHQDFIANSMKNFNQQFAKEIAKNSIFEAKLTTNAEIFQKYLANPEVCTITHSEKQLTF